MGGGLLRIVNDAEGGGVLCLSFSTGTGAEGRTVCLLCRGPVDDFVGLLSTGVLSCFDANKSFS